MILPMTRLKSTFKPSQNVLHHVRVFAFPKLGGVEIGFLGGVRRADRPLFHLLLVQNMECVVNVARFRKASEVKLGNVMVLSGPACHDGRPFSCPILQFLPPKASPARPRRQAGLPSFPESSGRDSSRQKRPALRQQRLNRLPDPHGHRSFRPSFSRQFFGAVDDPLAAFHPRLAGETLGGACSSSRKKRLVGVVLLVHDPPPFWSGQDDSWGGHGSGGAGSQQVVVATMLAKRQMCRYTALDSAMNHRRFRQLTACLDRPMPELQRNPKNVPGPMHG